MRKLRFLLFAQLVIGGLAAQIHLPKLIGDGMVLQREKPLHIWGWASPGETVQLIFLSKTYSTTTDSLGHWNIQLPPQKAGGPYTLALKGSNEILLKDILIGDVYLCSGQSNMELWMGRLKYKYPTEIQQAENPFIRQFLVPDKYNFKQAGTDFEEGTWTAVNSKTILNFSGVAYFFAKELYEKYRVPVCIINAALGGSPIQSWISEEGLKNFPSYQIEGQRYRDDKLIHDIESRDQKLQSVWNNYVNQFDQGHLKSWQTNGFGNAPTKDFSLPGSLAKADLKGFSGVVWLKKDLDIPASMTGKPAKLELGRIVDADSVFINGHFAGTTGYQYPPRRYELPGDVLRQGKNTITIRLVINTGAGEFVEDKRYELTAGTDTIDLKTNWNLALGIQATFLPDQTFIRWKPFGLYNAMIAPLKNYALKGIVWYQGESNVQKPTEYKDLLQALVNDWRQQFQQEQLPFLYVQLPNYLRSSSQPEESNWAELRNQQLQALEISNTAMAVAIDAGEWNDIHPEDKQVIAHRLALLAGTTIYQEKKLSSSGPILNSYKQSGSRLLLEFKETGGRIVSKDGSPLRYFSVAGEDGKYEWAQAIIKGNTLEVWSEKVVNPVYVRYAWANNPGTVNFYNRSGLPASPFQIRL